MIPENLQQYQGSEIIWEVLSSAGLPLDPDLRSLMEARFGRDFGRVRLHADHRAATSARALKAQAYTAGSHIVFGEGRYSPQTQESMWLLAHELVHVVQQSIELSAPPLELGNADDLLESEADRVADLIAAGRSLPPGFAFSPAPAGLIQCHNDVPCPGTRISAAAHLRSGQRSD
jgi:hypothetical protein